MEDDGTYLKHVNYDKEGGALMNYFPEQVEDIYDCTIRERVKVFQYILKRDSICVMQSNNIKKRANNSILASISKACRITPGIQQDNLTHLLLCRSFETGYSTTDIALEICYFSFQATPLFERVKKKQGAQYI